VNIAGIICEYNPIHRGHTHHIQETRRLLGEDTAVLCVMSGNFVQRGQAAIFEKHARAAAALRCGADLVVELPLPYALSSAERFAFGGVSTLNLLGCATHISFGSETGDLAPLHAVSECVDAPETLARMKAELKKGVSYPRARAHAVYSVLGEQAGVLMTPNNTLGIEYLRALKATQSSIAPVTIPRKGAQHDSAGAESASFIRKQFQAGSDPWPLIPDGAGDIYRAEIAQGRGPVFTEALEIAILSRLRMLQPAAFERLPDASEGLERRLMRAVALCPDIQSIARETKTKRYALSRIRRMILCAALGVTADLNRLPPPYVRVLAIGRCGREILSRARETAQVPVITKPASVRRLGGRALKLFELEAAATDLYTLAFDKKVRQGGREWTLSPIVDTE
jgi:predicted nucleotidyltransferase